MPPMGPLTLKFDRATLPFLKDRVWRPGCDLLWVHLNRNNSLNFQGIKTYDMSKNSHFPYLFTNIRNSLEFTRPNIGSGH